MFSIEDENLHDSGASSWKATPVPFPNTEVKLLGPLVVQTRESRWAPESWRFFDTKFLNHVICSVVTVVLDNVP